MCPQKRPTVIMGVVYRLTPEISAFIIGEKQKDPKATCQNLSGRVFLQFGQQVSKSSVHALLKQAHVITPRTHKIKDKFKIPIEKKAEISKALAPFRAEQAVVINAPQPPLLKRGGVETVEEEIKTPSLLKEGEGGVNPVKLVPGMGNIFLKAALWDLSYKPIFGMNDFSEMDQLKDEKIKEEWEYLTQEVYAIKIETQGGSFYIDPRFEGLYASNVSQENLSVPIERAIGEVTDQILNNIKPLILRKEQTSDLMSILYEFFDAFENRIGKEIKRIALIGARNREFIEFKEPLAYQRHFIVGISSNHEELQWVKEDSRLEVPWPDPALGMKILKIEDNFIVTNMVSSTYEEIVNKYQERHWESGLQLSGAIKGKNQEQEVSLPQWLKRRLKDRATMYFSLKEAEASLEKALLLPGHEILQKNTRDIYLQVPESFEHKENLLRAIENINSADIKDFKAIKVRVYVDS